MKPLLEDISKKRGKPNLIAFEIEQQKLDFYWHYHPEYELTLIIKGNGTRMVGDHHENFKNDDLVLIGPGLPHTWVSDNNRKGKCKVVVVQFSNDFIQTFLGLEETKRINNLLLNANLGLSFNANIGQEIKNSIIALPTMNGIEKITCFLLILDALSKQKTNPLASSYYQPLKGIENEKRINTVCQYIQKHAGETLTIHKAASLIHLSPSAFCKFFKRITGKTFSDYVNDIRIANACKELLATDKLVAEIAYKNGFETLTYFNRVFLKKKGVKPSNFRKGKG